MSNRKPKRIEELIQTIKLASQNPNLFREEQLKHALVEAIYPTSEDVSLGRDIYYASYTERPSADDELIRKDERQVNEICQKVRVEVLEQLRSDISRLLDATRKEASVENMTRAITESIRRMSEIPEVRKIYALVEPENLHFIIAHSGVDRIGVLRRIVEVENSLDSKFEEIYFEFKVLHLSEIDENLVSDNLLIFERA